jgi:casein kinase 1
MLQLGDIVGRRYQVLSKLGNGKFGIVFQARNTTTNETVAIKTEQVDTPAKVLKNETTLLKYLYDQGCRYSPIVYWYGVSLNTTCLVFSYYKMTLYDYLHVSAVDDQRKDEIMRTCVVILEEIHKHYVIHRDIKPQNFMIRNGELFLIDFGLATFYIDPSGDHTPDIISEQLVGTPKYISFNVHCGHTASRRDDLISLGYMLFWMYFGELPWETSGLDEIEFAPHNYNDGHVLHPLNFYRKDRKSWYMLENLSKNNKKLHRYLDYCYRIEYEGSPLYGELEKIFVDS